MEVDYKKELSSELRRGLFKRLEELEKEGTMTAQGIANILLGLAKMEAKYADLPEDGRASLLRILNSRTSRLNDQNIANSIHR